MASTLCWCLALLPGVHLGAAPFIRGDVDANGVLELTDAVLLLNYLFLDTPNTLPCEDAADENDSGEVDLSDALHNIVHLFIGGPPPPIPFPDCGDDPTDDGLDCQAHSFCRAPSCEKSALETGSVDVGGHKLWFRAAGQGCPGIVVEAGFADTGSGSWNTFMYQIGALSRTLVYDRAGLGNSSELGPEPRTSLQLVTELHTLLQNVGFDPPYVLVGHSKGGYDIRTFANLFPTEVVGMVFVDPSHEWFTTQFKELYPAEWDVWMKLFAGYIASLPEAAQREWDPWFVYWLASPGPIPDVPIVVLTADSTSNAAFTKEFNEVLKELWNVAHEKLSRSVTNGTHIRLEGVGHFIHSERPQVVLDAIRQVLEAAR